MSEHYKKPLVKYYSAKHLTLKSLLLFPFIYTRQLQAMRKIAISGTWHHTL